jgi:type I site-specific restriction endonuclease
MQELLKSFCFSRDKGLLLVDMPTGTGKTYNAIRFIYENYKNVKNKK